MAGTSDIVGDILVEEIICSQKIKEERCQELWDRLTSNPYYFFHWIQSNFHCSLEQMPRDKYSLFLKKTFQYNKPPRKGTKRQCFSELASLEQIVFFYTTAFSNLGREGKGNKAARSFATKCVRDAKKFMDIIISEDLPSYKEYLGGLEFLGRWTQLHISLLRGKKFLDDDIANYDDAEQEFQNLQDRSQALVLAVKVFFLGPVEKVLPSQDGEWKTGILREMVQLDRKNFAWHYHLGNSLRRDRRAKRDRTLEPSPEEIQIWWETYQSCEYKHDIEERPLRRISWANVCRAVAEVYRVTDHKKRLNDFQINIGALMFQDEVELQDFIIDEVKKIASTNTSTFEELIRAGGIIAGIVPLRCRDFVTGELCYTRALALKDIGSRSSKLNHHLGILYLRPELKNREKAISHLREAVQLDGSNFWVAADLISVLLTSPSENKEEIKKLSNDLKVLELLNHERVKFVFLLACLDYMTGDMLGAIRGFTNCHRLSEEEHEKLWKGLKGRIGWYSWNAEMLDICKVKNAFLDYCRTSTGTRGERLFITNMIETLFPTRAVQRGLGPPITMAADNNENWRSSNNTPSIPRRDHEEENQGSSNSNRYVPPHRRNQRND